MYVRLEKRDRQGKMALLAWIGVLVGWNSESPCHRVWDPSTNKVHNVGHAHADFDESVVAGWWRGQNIGKKGNICEIDAATEMTWPDLVLEELASKRTWLSVDEEVPDAAGNPLPQLQTPLSPQNDKIPELVRNSCADESDTGFLPSSDPRSRGGRVDLVISDFGLRTPDRISV